MVEKFDERKWVAGVFGSGQTVNDLVRKASGSIYYHIFLHNPVKDPDLRNGIKRNLAKNLTTEDFKKLDEAYDKLTK